MTPTYLKTLQSELSTLFNHAVRFYELKSNSVVKAGSLGKGKSGGNVVLDKRGISEIH